MNTELFPFTSLSLALLYTAQVTFMALCTHTNLVPDCPPRPHPSFLNGYLMQRHLKNVQTLSRQYMQRIESQSIQLCSHAMLQANKRSQNKGTLRVLNTRAICQSSAKSVKSCSGSLRRISSRLKCVPLLLSGSLVDVLITFLAVRIFCSAEPRNFWSGRLV